MKIFRIVFNVIVAFVVLLASLIVYASIGKTDTFYVESGQFKDFDYLKKLDKKLETQENYSALIRESSAYVHRISKGNGTIIAYRWYSNGIPMLIDDESFKKLTIWLSEQPTSYPAEIDLANSETVKVAYTTGGSAWPKSACSGYLKSGYLKLDKSKSSIRIKINGTVMPAGTIFFRETCKEKELNIEFSASEIKFTELTPWLGLPGDHPYDETYR